MADYGLLQLNKDFDNISQFTLCHSEPVPESGLGSKHPCAVIPIRFGISLSFINLVFKVIHLWIHAFY
jgi:hypothetical protein